MVLEVLVQFTMLGYLRNWQHTGGLPQDRHCVPPEAQVKHGLHHITELVRTLPENLELMAIGLVALLAFSLLHPLLT